MTDVRLSFLKDGTALTGIGRRELIEAAKTELLAAYANLTAVQARCTEMLEERREIGEAFAPLAARLRWARSKHPLGPDIRALVEEIGEVASAIRRESPDRVCDELLDVAVIALRLYLGEGRLYGLMLPGWDCHRCRAFNGDAKERLENCRACGCPRA